MVRNKVFSKFDFKVLSKTQMEVLLRMVNEQLYLVQVNIPFGKFHFETLDGISDSAHINRKTGNALYEFGAITEVKRIETYKKTVIYYVPARNFVAKLEELELEKK